MDEAFEAYDTGRADGIAGRRNHAGAGDRRTGADYRIGFLDGRIEVFRMFTTVRKITDED